MKNILNITLLSLLLTSTTVCASAGSGWDSSNEDEKPNNDSKALTVIEDATSIYDVLEHITSFVIQGESARWENAGDDLNDLKNWRLTCSRHAGVGTSPIIRHLASQSHRKATNGCLTNHLNSLQQTVCLHFLGANELDINYRFRGTRGGYKAILLEDDRPVRTVPYDVPALDIFSLKHVLQADEGLPVGMLRLVTAGALVDDREPLLIGGQYWALLRADAA